MKIKEVIGLISDIGRELQSTMTTTQINVYLGRFGVASAKESVAPSKWVYVREILANESDELVLQIASDLELSIPSASSISLTKFGDLLANKEHCQQDFNSALENVETNPGVAIGMASTTLESVCKAILDELEEPYPSDENLQSLYKSVSKNLNLSPLGHADADIKRILGGLANIGAGISTIRTRYSAFHGKGAEQKRLGRRHARLAVNAMATMGYFLIETYEERFNADSN